MNLLTTYEHMLNLGGLIVSPDGLVSVALSDKNMPALINVKEDNGYVEKRLVLPTKQQLQLEGGWDRRIAFHPLKENLFTGESKVVEYLRKAINFRFNQVIQELIDQSLVYASSTEYHKKLNSDQLSLLEAVKEADQTMINNFRKILKQVKPTDTKNSFVSIYLKKLGKINGENYACVGNVTFPFYNELINSEKEFHGVKLRKNDFACLQRILEFIIPNIGVKEYYNVGISESIVPFAECLIRLTNKLGNELNKVTTLLYKKSTHIPKEERDLIYNLLYFNDEHMPVFDNIDSLLPEIRLIPQLPGNEPKERQQSNMSITQPVIEKEEEMIPQHRNTWEDVSATPQMQTQPQVSQPTYQQPVAQSPIQPMVQMPPSQGTVVDELPALRDIRPPAPTMNSPYGYQQYPQVIPQMATPMGVQMAPQNQMYPYGQRPSPFTPAQFATPVMPGPMGMPAYNQNPPFQPNYGPSPFTRNL